MWLAEVVFCGNAPVIAQSAFSGVYATAYYPAGNATWTEDVMQQYGGGLTWEPYGEVCDHSYEAVVTEPTCTEQGYTTYTCTNCGDRYISDETAPLGHDMSGWRTVTEADCKIEGLERNECVRCGHTEEHVLPALGHEFVDGVCSRCSQNAEDAEIVASGTCGENVTWGLTEDGTLTISGQGPMDNLAMMDPDYYWKDLAPWKDSRDEIRNVVIQEGVTNIGDGAFHRCRNLTSVTIPDGVTTIGNRAFSECKSLVDVTIPDSVTTIGDAAFVLCHSLTSVTIPYGVTTVAYLAFSDCISMTSVTIPDSVTTIDLSAFASCHSLTSVTIPDSVTTIAYSAFANCTGLTSVTIPDSVTSIGDYAFSNCKSMVNVTISGSVATIGGFAFQHCANLASVTFCGDAPSIGDGAFRNATAAVYYPAGNATWTEEVMQQYGGNLTWEPYGEVCDHSYEAVVTEPTCTEQGYTTYTCTNCGDSYVSDYEDALGHDYVNGKCTRCGEFEHDAAVSVTVSGDESTTIDFTPTESGNYAVYMPLGNYVFDPNTGMVYTEDFYFQIMYRGSRISGSMANLDEYAASVAFLEAGKTYQIVATGYFPETVTITADVYVCKLEDPQTIILKVFDEPIGMTYGTTIQCVPGEGLPFIGGSNTITWTVDNENILTFVDYGWPNEIAVEGIAPGTATVTATLSSGVSTSITVTVYEDACGESIRWIPADENGVLRIQGNGDMDNYDSVGSAPWYPGASEITDIYISAMNGEGVTSIGNYAFSGLHNLRNVSFGWVLSHIGDYAFYQCSKLMSVVIPDTVKTIGEGAFADTGLKLIVFDGSAPAIGEKAFDSVTAIALYPAGDASWTKSVMKNYGGKIIWIPYSDELLHGICGEALIWFLNHQGILTIFGTGAMYDYSAPARTATFGIDAKNAVTSLRSTGEMAPWHDVVSNIQRIEIGEEVTSIGAHAFSNCNMVQSITIPAGITTIGQGAFSDCTELAEISFDGDAPEIGDGAFENVNAEVRYPEDNDSWDEDTLEDYGGSITWVPHGENVGEGIVASGTCGDNATWVLTEDGTLTISGTGEMYSYYGDGIVTPWNDHREEITNLVIEEGITVIGEAAFASLTGLKSVSLPASLDYIGNFAFMCCEALETLDLPENLTGIGQQAFWCCCSLKSVIIPASVTFLDACAFEECTALTDVLFLSDPDIPGFSTGNSLFRNCTSLEAIRVEEGHLGLESIDGVLYFIWRDSGEMCLSDYPAGKKDTQYRIADNTVIINQMSFWRNPYLEELIIPATVNSIGNYSFMGCSGLKTIRFEGSMPEAGSSMFWGVNATVSYPCGDSSWDNRESWNTEDYLGSDGSVTWAVSHEFADGSCIHCGEEEPVSHIPGDISGDGELNNKDLTRLFRYLSGYDVDVNEEALDVTGDGVVNNKDLTRLFRYLSGYDVEIH